jgi:hypothetical protein
MKQASIASIPGVLVGAAAITSYLLATTQVEPEQ